MTVPRISVVTGGSGFIGRHLVQLLRDQGETVRVLDLVELKPRDPQVQFIHGSILDRHTVQAALAGADRLYHLAANPDLWARDKSSFLETNYCGTKLVLEEADRAGVSRIVYTSTESILKGRRRVLNDGQIDETIELALADMPGPYCRSKFLAEQEATAAARRGLPVVIVNPTLPVGPGDYRLTPPTKMLVDFLNGDNPAYLDFELNMIDVRDAALGHLLAADHGRLGRRYILGGDNLRLSEVLDTLHDLTGLPMPRRRIPYAGALVVAAVSELIANVVTRRPPKASLTGVRLAGSPMNFNCTRAVTELGLPQTPVRTALADAVVWLAERGLIRPTRTLPIRPRAICGAESRSRSAA